MSTGMFVYSSTGCLIALPSCYLSLRQADCLAGTYTSACATLGASVCVNLINIALRDCFYGALGQTGATSDTIVTNNVSHNKILFKCFCIICALVVALLICAILTFDDAKVVNVSLCT